MHTCPVCGFGGLMYPPENFTICPSCYTEFGYEDTSMSYEQLTLEWIRKGLPWEAANVVPPPDDWEHAKYEQLRSIGFLDYTPALKGTQPQPEISFIDLGEQADIVSTPDPSIAQVGIKHHVLAIGRMFTQTSLVPANA